MITPHFKSPNATHRLAPSNLFGAWDVYNAETGRVIGTINQTGNSWEARLSGRERVKGFSSDYNAFAYIVEDEQRSTQHLDEEDYYL